MASARRVRLRDARASTCVSLPTGDSLAPWALEPLSEVPELVAHQDYCPGNVVFRDGRPVARIDFDLARSTTRVADLVNLLHWWAPLQDPVDRAPAPTDAVPRVRAAVEAYGLTPAQRAEVVPVAVRRARNVVHAMRAAADVDPVLPHWGSQRRSSARGTGCWPDRSDGEGPPAGV